MTTTSKNGPVAAQKPWLHTNCTTKGEKKGNMILLVHPNADTHTHWDPDVRLYFHTVFSDEEAEQSNQEAEPEGRQLRSFTEEELEEDREFVVLCVIT